MVDKVKKWEDEKKTLESVKRNLKKYSKLKTDKAGKDEVDKINAKIANAIDENSWMKLSWKEIKRSKASREEAIERIDDKIKTRKKKLEAETKGHTSFDKPLGVASKDWSKEISECTYGSVYFHWLYGKMEVLSKENDYIYLKVLDKKGCKSKAELSKEVKIEIDGKEEALRKFNKNSIGRWLFTTEKGVQIKDKKSAHSIFSK